MQPEPNWWSDFFRGPVLDVVRAMMPPEVTTAECEFVRKHLALPAGAAVLDVPCGAGRHALELARRGWRMTGVDLSAELIADATRVAMNVVKDASDSDRELRERRSEGARTEARTTKLASTQARTTRQAGAEAAGFAAASVTADGVAAAAPASALDATFLVADMRELPGPATFDGAYCFGNSFAYLDDAGNAAFLAAVRRALRPGGRFLLETRLCAESVLAAPRAKSWYQFGDVIMLHETRYEPAEGRLVSEYGFIGGKAAGDGSGSGGPLERRAAGYRIYLYRELMAMFAAAGFAVEQTFGSLGGEPFGLGSGALYVLSRAD